MKKFLGLLMALLLVIIPVNIYAEEDKKEEAEKEKVRLHIFYGETCSFCAELHAFTDQLLKDKDYNYMFEVVDYEVWYDEVNSDLMSSVAQYLGVSVTGVPFYVIGEKSFSGYSDETSPQKIKDAIEEAYNDEDYEDVVTGIGEGNITVDDKDLDEVEEDNDVIGYIILGITAVIVIAIICGRSGNTYYDDKVYDEEDEEESVIEEKEEVKEEKPVKKATNSKKSSTTKKTTSTKKKK